MPNDMPTPLVSAEWLAEHLDSWDIVVLDSTFFLPQQGKNACQTYLESHIPRARFFDIDEVADKHTSLPHMVPSESLFSETMDKWGIDSHTQVVVYDQNYFMASARAWWTFRAFGHKRVSVLDGGWQRWKALGLPTESGAVSPSPRSGFKSVFHPALVRTLGEMKILYYDTSTQIVDARSPGRFAGTEPEPRPGIRSGHIPHSRNVFFRTLIEESTFCLKPKAELERIFAEAGVDPRRAIVTTCGTGVTASILALALYGLGNEYVAVYDGSWSEWGGREDTPVETGP